MDSRRTFKLDAVRADGWFEKLGEGAPTFGQLCQVVGEKFVAFSVIAGVRITAITVDQRSEEASLVDFSVGDSTDEQRLPLGEFRKRLGAALLADEPSLPELGTEPNPEDLQAFIGYRWVLLAPIFGIRLRELQVPASHAEEAPMLVVDLGGASDEVSLEDFREVIRERIRGEVARSRATAPFAIDLNAIPQAERALRDGDHERAIELLGTWPGPLSLLLRTPEGQQLASDVKATLAKSMGILGSAYVADHRFEWAEEVLRLGIQWGQDGAAAADLYRRLGESCALRERFGEAIGMLRRAISLGAPQRDVLPLLGRCYADRNRWVAAAICLDEAIALGVNDESVFMLRDAAVARLGVAYDVFREKVPIAKSGAITAPVPGEEKKPDAQKPQER